MNNAIDILCAVLNLCLFECEVVERKWEYPNKNIFKLRIKLDYGHGEFCEEVYINNDRIIYDFISFVDSWDSIEYASNLISNKNNDPIVIRKCIRHAGLIKKRLDKVAEILKDENLEVAYKLYVYFSKTKPNFNDSLETVLYKIKHHMTDYIYKLLDDLDGNCIM